MLVDCLRQHKRRRNWGREKVVSKGILGQRCIHIIHTRKLENGKSIDIHTILWL